MKLFKKLLLFILLVVVALAAVSQFLPGHYQMQRSLIIDAKADAIYPWISDLKKWPEWSAWTTAKDPTLTYTYEGPEQGVGAISKWESQKFGQGRMTITESDPEKGVKFDVSFEQGRYLSHHALLFSPAGFSTKVTWSIEGDVSRNPMDRWFCLFIERLSAPDFEEGLQNLKKKAEANFKVK